MWVYGCVHWKRKEKGNWGHSVTRKLNPDGKVIMMQTLHNMSEDELAGFEEAWKGNANMHLPGWKEGFNLHGNAGAGSSGQEGQSPWGGWALLSIQHSGNAGGIGSDNGAGTNSSGGRAKKVVRINIE
ncbi:hypothetical protein L1049_018579 [Liquidambar formosana]|uniref:Uncharacterized protein n=1 Tax=Liquidambar formosana TaxID=63359 RepID=A0AAP0RAA4_LIQFO